MESGSLADWVSGLGSLTAVAIALWGYWIVARQRGTDRRQAERAIAYEVIAVIHELSNNILTIQKHVGAARNDITLPAKKLHFRIINPLIGLSSEGELRLPAGSAELLVKAKAEGLWNQATLVANHNRALVSIMKEYRSLWTETMARFPTFEELPDGGLGQRWDAAQFDAVKPELIKLDAIVGHLEEHANEAATLAHEVAAAIGPAFRAFFNEPILHLIPAARDDKRR